MVNNKTLKLQQRKIWLLDVSYIPLAVAAIVSIAGIYLVYMQTQDILKERLRERLSSITATAVVGIDPQQVERLIEIENRNPDDALKSTELNDLVTYIKRIRDANEQLRYIYILNKPEDSEELAAFKFTADAEMINPIDIDGNGIIEDIEIPPAPGEDYEITDVDVIDDAMRVPIAANELYSDKWGTFLSGYAPIKNDAGDTIAILAIDVQVEDFTTLIRSTLVPFSILAIILLLMLSIQTIALVRIWRSRVEIVKELDRQKDELLSIVSHQLATPVSSMKWYLEMMLDGDVGKLTKEQKEHVESLQAAATNLADLVSMILDVSRIQLGRMKVDRSELDLDAFFKEIVDVVNSKAQERMVELKVEKPSKLPVGNVDKRLMRMILENLLSNAVKYSPEEKGKVVLHIETKGNILKYTVSDNGCGVPDADKEKIFGKLFRATNVQKVDGNGFGLYAAKGAAEALEGTIRFESKEDVGTTFYVEVPLKSHKK
ncbi:MAG: HAMP domain-containing sensor histidine kinase [bacterium]|nr:HAMP domain-containing sensor histidine kinase [bacterium]